MNKSVATSFTNNDSYGTDEEYWVHIEQVLPDDITPTLGEVATLVDSLYGINECDDTVTDTPYNADDDDYSDIPDTLFKDAQIVQLKAAAAQEKTAFFLSQVKLYTSMNLCAVDASTGDYKTEIKVGRSHQSEDYTLRIINGVVGITQVIRETYTEVYNIEKRSSLELPFPVIVKEGEDPSFMFENVVYGPYGYQSAPDVTLSGRTLSWEGPITGELTVTYPTIYDLVEITVYGNADGTADEDAQALCFYHKMMEAITLEKPDVDGDATQIDKDKYCLTAENGGIVFEQPPNTDVVLCYENVRTNYVCQCSPDIVSYYTDTRVTVPCPSENMKCTLGLGSDAHEVDGHTECSQYMGSRTIIGGYVSCPDSLYNNQTGESAPNPETSPITEDWYYKLNCCVDPDGPLPVCSSIYELNTGQQLDEDVAAEYKRRYGDQLRLIPVSPEDGDCGYINTVVGVKSLTCCEFVDPLVLDVESSAEVVADNSFGYIHLDEPSARTITVSVTGSGFFANSARTSKKADYASGASVVTVYTANACGSGTVTITDGCTTVVHTVRATTGHWELDESLSTPSCFPCSGGTCTLKDNIIVGGLRYFTSMRWIRGFLSTIPYCATCPDVVLHNDGVPRDGRPNVWDYTVIDPCDGSVTAMWTYWFGAPEDYDMTQITWTQYENVERWVC